MGKKNSTTSRFLAAPLELSESFSASLFIPFCVQTHCVFHAHDAHGGGSGRSYDHAVLGIYREPCFSLHVILSAFACHSPHFLMSELQITALHVDFQNSPANGISK